jgi:CRP-like cAMP-binding protein
VNPLWSNFFRNKLEEESLAYFIGTVPIFTDLGKRDRVLLESLVHVRTYKKDEIVFEEGDPGSGMYIIRSGRIQIFSKGGDGNEMEIARLGGGDFFGETTLTAPSSRTASARALEPTELFGLFRADVLELSKKQPAIACKILMGVTRVISERLQVAGKDLMRLRQEHPELFTEETES